ncbi:MAG: hypothetical protein LKH33_08400 [Acetobacter sp.]|jgi:hypothetical protein|nr:hypothetical protein [Acetobacter sp.]MCI1485814.1 hypothetical protein [Acetobacter sp.]MCI1529804.1 hypothetical protein [Acetobacter sp.]MCI1587527.1 hypothetical protein [Acetobacter sp.]MCI1601744.1 hypothetical protein [Acetobacter sp.]
MAAISSFTPSTPQEARERLLTSLHDAGIETSSPLGLIMISQCESISLACARFDKAAEALSAASRTAEMGLADLREQLTHGVKQVESLKASGENRIRTQEIFLEREQTAAVAKIVASIEQALTKNAVAQQEDLFKALKKRLPENEELFYRQIRWNRIFVAFVIAAGLVTLGYWSGSRVSSEETVRGHFCSEHLQYDNSTGMQWCPLTLPSQGTRDSRS